MRSNYKVLIINYVLWFCDLLTSVYSLVYNKKGISSALFYSSLPPILVYDKGISFGLKELFGSQNLMDLLTNMEIVLLFVYFICFFFISLFVSICFFRLCKILVRFFVLVIYCFYIIVQILVFHRWYILINLYRIYITNKIIEKTICSIFVNFKERVSKFRFVRFFFKYWFYFFVFFLFYFLFCYITGVFMFAYLFTTCKSYLINFWLFIKLYKFIIYLKVLFFSFYSYYLVYNMVLGESVSFLFYLFMNISFFFSLYLFKVYNVICLYIYLVDYYFFGTFIKYITFNYYIFLYKRSLRIFLPYRYLRKHIFYFIFLYGKYYILIIYKFIYICKFVYNGLMLYLALYKTIFITIFFKLPLLLGTFLIFFFYCF